jgi:signal transduction histidine kinase
MAHEINNPLESVVNLIYLACSDKGLSQQTRAYLTAADEELARVSHITKQTLGFYRESSAPLPTRMSQLLDTLVLVYGTRLRNKNIQLKIDAGREIEVPVVRGEIRQVLANILQNSIEAVAHGGAIRVRTAKARRWTDEAEGLKVSFADNGSGIPRHDRSRIFEPFFTTKKDIGTGLGLWVSKGILDRHGGNIRIRSKAEPGNGWTVTSIFLPAVSQLLPEDAPSAHSFL